MNIIIVVRAENDECSFNCDLFSADAVAAAAAYFSRTFPMFKSRFFAFFHRAAVLVRFLLFHSILFFSCAAECVFIKMYRAVENYEPKEKTLNLYFFLLSLSLSIQFIQNENMCVACARTHIINII